MRQLISAFLLAWASAGLAGVLPASAADLPRERAPEWAAEEDSYMLAQVEGLYLRSGCPRGKDCLPPRILPVPGARAIDFVTVAVPLDPRRHDRPR